MKYAEYVKLLEFIFQKLNLTVKNYKSMQGNILNLDKNYISFIPLIGKNNVTSQNSWVFSRGNFRFDIAHVCIVSL